MKRGGPLKRSTELARGAAPMRRTQMKRGAELRTDPTYRFPQRSRRRSDDDGRRREVRAEVARRSGGRCQYAAVIPEVPCGFFVDRPGMEVDEMRGGAWRSTEYLDPDRCRLTCPAHHDWKTDHKRLVLQRLAEHEGGPDVQEAGEPPPTRGA